MNRTRVLLIVIGTALILLVVAIAAFSLGVYVGVRGWTADPPAVAGPGQRLVPPVQVAPQSEQRGQTLGQPLQVPRAAAPAGPQPQLIGRVRSLSKDTVTLGTPQGPRLFQLAPAVQVARVVEGQGEVPASLEEVRLGSRLAVFGRFEGDGARRLVAQRLLLLPETQP